MTDVRSWLTKRFEVFAPNNAATLADVTARVMQAPFNDTPPIVLYNKSQTGPGRCFQLVLHALENEFTRLITYMTRFRSDVHGKIVLTYEINHSNADQFHLCATYGDVPQGCEGVEVYNDDVDDTVTEDDVREGMADVRRLHRAYMDAGPGVVTLEDVFAS